MLATGTDAFEEMLVSPEFVANPYPLLRQLREEEPVYWSEAIGGWLLTRYDDVARTFKDASVFSNENRFGTKQLEHLTAEKRVGYAALEHHYAGKSLLHADPPDHTRLRGLVNQEFTPKVAEQMRPRIQELVDELLDAAASQGGMDVVHDFAEILPLSVIAAVFGFPVSDRPLILKWTEDILGFQGVNKPAEEDLSRAQQALVEIRAYIREMIQERRRRPQQDLMSKLVAVESDGDRLSEDELIRTCQTFFIGGHETTVSTIGSTIYTLLANRDQWELLKRNPELLGPAIEESIRYETPAPRSTRRVKVETELGGKKLKKDEIVFQMVNAANRDPAYFDDPDTFNIQREKNRHLAFGLGIHFCVGAALARAEATIAVGSVVRRFPNLQPTESKADWDVSKRAHRALRRLPVRF